MYTQETFYHSKKWERFRSLIIAERTNDDGYVICDVCGKPIVNPYDLIVHHKTELNDINVNDYDISLNPDNVVTVHHDCHNKVHSRFGKQNYMNRTKYVTIIYGAPCSGKTTYVSEHATMNDIIIDMDNIYQMISTNDRYIKPKRLSSTVFAIRDQLYDIVRYRRGTWTNAFIVTGGARSGERTRLKERVNADEFIFIDTDKDTCLIRAKEKPKEWIKYIDQWFEAYEPEQK